MFKLLLKSLIAALFISQATLFAADPQPTGAIVINQTPQTEKKAPPKNSELNSFQGWLSTLFIGSMVKDCFQITSPFEDLPAFTAEVMIIGTCFYLIDHGLTHYDSYKKGITNRAKTLSDFLKNLHHAGKTTVQLAGTGISGAASVAHASYNLFRNSYGWLSSKLAQRNTSTQAANTTTPNGTINPEVTSS